MVAAATTASNAAASSGAVFGGGAVVVVTGGLSRVGRPGDGGTATTPGDVDVGGAVGATVEVGGRAVVEVEAGSTVVVDGGVADVAAVSSDEFGNEASATMATPAAPINQTRLAMCAILAASSPGSAAATVTTVRSHERGDP